MQEVQYEWIDDLISLFELNGNFLLVEKVLIHILVEWILMVIQRIIFFIDMVENYFYEILLHDDLYGKLKF